MVSGRPVVDVTQRRRSSMIGRRDTDEDSMRREVLMLAAVVVFAAACARDSTPGGETSPHDAGSVTGGGLADAGLVATCGAVRFSDLPPDTSALRAFRSWEEIDRSGLGGEGPFLDDFVEAYDWFVTEESGGSLVLFGEARGSVEQDVPYAYASLTSRDGSLVPAGWGQCGIELGADGWGPARFILDPSVRPDPDSHTLSVLATEVDCASGQPPVGRDVRAVVLDETQTTVSIVILVETRGGDCPSNPRFPFEVDLPSPLGDRAILDASGHPPERVWPPE